jgi:hypothetical protein
MSNDHNENWYTNKDLFEMFQSLKDELQQTRSDIRQYNNLRGAIAEVQKTQISIVDNCRKNTTSPEGYVYKLYGEIGELKEQWTQFLGSKQGKKSVEEAFLRWGGWVIGTIVLGVAVAKIFIN